MQRIADDPPSFEDLVLGRQQAAAMVGVLRDRPAALLLLTVHGVGPSGADGAKIRLHHLELTRSRDTILQTCLPDFADREDLCIDVRGIDWQRDVHNQLQVDETLAKVTPLGLAPLRAAINARAADVLLYAEPQRHVLQAAVRRSLNAAFLDYVAEHPERASWNLHVVLLAHSLGSVICYDLLAAPRPASPATPGAEPPLAGLPPSPESAIQARLRGRLGWPATTVAIPPGSGPSGLLFPVLALYLLGSPLGLFLASRGHCTGTMAAPYPPTSQGSTYLYNVIHANDPVAYRIEPYVSNALATAPPLPLPHHRTLGANGKATVLATVGATTVAGLLHPLAGLATVAAGLAGHATRKSAKRLPDAQHQNPARCSGRLDFVLQTDLAEDLSGYANVLAAHKAYWFSRDLMYFVLTQSLKAMLLPEGTEPGRVLPGPPPAPAPAPPPLRPAAPAVCFDWLACPAAARTPPEPPPPPARPAGPRGRPPPPCGPASNSETPGNADDDSDSDTDGCAGSEAAAAPVCQPVWLEAGDSESDPD